MNLALEALMVDDDVIDGLDFNVSSSDFRNMNSILAHLPCRFVRTCY